MPRPEVLTALGMTPGEWGSKTEKERQILREKADRILNGQEEAVTKETPLTKDLIQEQFASLAKHQEEGFRAIDARFTSLEERLAELEKPESEKTPTE